LAIPARAPWTSTPTTAGKTSGSSIWQRILGRLGIIDGDMGPQKVGIALVLLMLLAMPMVVGAVEEPKVYSREEIRMYEEDGWVSGFSIAGGLSEDATVGESTLLKGDIYVNLHKGTGGEEKLLHGFVSGVPVEISVYKDGLRIVGDTVITDSTGKFEYNRFIPKERGYYNLVFSYPAGTGQTYAAQDGWLSTSGTAFYVSEETTPTPTPTPTPPTLGFEAVFAIIGLLAVAYLIRRGR